MRWLGIMEFFGRLSKHDVPPSAPIDPLELQAEMAGSDPEYTRIRQLHHDGLQAVAAAGAADGLAIRREREFWTRHGGQQH